MAIVDSGTRRKFDSGAVRDIQEGKGRCDLLPLGVVAQHMNDGCLTEIYKFEVNGSANHLYQTLNLFSYEYGGVTGDVSEDRAAYARMYLEVSKHFEEGAKKYGEHNWQKGIPINCYIDSAVRHYLKFVAGYTDESHDRAFVWNILCCIWETDFRIREKEATHD